MSDTVLITLPDTAEVLHLRYPTFAEWHSLAKEHEEIAGKPPSAELIARTVATCLCDDDGKPVKVDKAKVLAWPHKRAMWVYKKCWTTVLRSDDDSVSEMEKNSEAGQD